MEFSARLVDLLGPSATEEHLRCYLTEADGDFDGAVAAICRDVERMYGESVSRRDRREIARALSALAD